MGQSGKFRLLDSGKFQLGGGFNATDGKFSVDSDCCCPACLGCAVVSALGAEVSFAVAGDSDCFDGTVNPNQPCSFCHDVIGTYQSNDLDISESHYEDSDMCWWVAGPDTSGPFVQLVYWKATQKMYAALNYSGILPHFYQWNSDAYFASGATEPGDYYGDPSNTTGDGEQYLKFMKDITGDLVCSDTNGGEFIGTFTLDGGLCDGEADDEANCHACTITVTCS